MGCNILILEFSREKTFEGLFLSDSCNRVIIMYVLIITAIIFISNLLNPVFDPLSF